jgi:hypothetical protein
MIGVQMKMTPTSMQTQSKTMRITRPLLWGGDRTHTNRHSIRSRAFPAEALIQRPKH